tara:strand:- start:949 stop:1485 length:537 start_codon:yes stop_codon:yes gene_type:complete
MSDRKIVERMIKLLFPELNIDYGTANLFDEINRVTDPCKGCGRKRYFTNNDPNAFYLEAIKGEDFIADDGSLIDESAAFNLNIFGPYRLFKARLHSDGHIEYFSDLDEEGLEHLLWGITIFYIKPMTKLEEISFDSFDSESEDDLADFDEFMEINRDGAMTPPLLNNTVVTSVGYSFI